MARRPTPSCRRARSIGTPICPVPSYNVALAKQLMKQSKFPNGFTMTMEVPSGDSVSNTIDVILKSELQPLGITLNLRQEDQTTLFNDQQKAKYHITNNLWTNDIPDPDELVSFAVNYNLPARDRSSVGTTTRSWRTSRSRRKRPITTRVRKADYFKIQTDLHAAKCSLLPAVLRAVRERRGDQRARLLGEPPRLLQPPGRAQVVAGVVRSIRRWAASASSEGGFSSRSRFSSGSRWSRSS